MYTQCVGWFVCGELVVWFCIQTPTKTEPSVSEKETEIKAADEPSQTEEEQKVSTNHYFSDIFKPLCNSFSILR